MADPRKQLLDPLTQKDALPWLLKKIKIYLLSFSIQHRREERMQYRYMKFAQRQDIRCFFSEISWMQSIWRVISKKCLERGWNEEVVQGLSREWTIQETTEYQWPENLLLVNSSNHSEENRTFSTSHWTFKILQLMNYMNSSTQEFVCVGYQMTSCQTLSRNFTMRLNKAFSKQTVFQVRDQMISVW